MRGKWVRRGRAGVVAPLVLWGCAAMLPGQVASVPEPGGGGLQATIANLIAQPAVVRAHWGVLVETMEGEPLAAVQASQLFEPASNAKLLTTAAAMALLGAGATTETTVVGRGTLEGGTLRGDLVLVGAGDATLATDDIPYRTPAEQKEAAAATPSGVAAAGAAGTLGPAMPAPHPLRALETLADQVVAAGVRTIVGDVVGSDTRWAWEPYPEGWSVDDLMWGYGAPVGALAVHDNQMELRVQPGAAVGASGEAVLEPGMPGYYTVDAAGLTTTAAKTGTHVGMDRAVGSHLVRVWGTIALGAKDEVEELAMQDPAEFAAVALRAMLVERGVTVEGVARAEHRMPVGTAGFREQVEVPVALPATPALAAEGMPGKAACEEGAACDERVLARVRSATLAEDERFTAKTSQNLHAELLLERLGRRFGAQTSGDGGTGGPVDPGSRAQGVRVVRSFLENVGVDPGDVALRDGSGLSGADLVTPRALTTLLVWAGRQPWFGTWRAALPVGGEDGTLQNRFRKTPLAGRVFAKTGTLGEARALSGYVQCASGRTVAFSVMVDNHAPGGTADREAMDGIVAAIYAAE